jgi:hypothetical protein
MKTEAFNIRDPQGLRRPRFSFFIFTCQTAWVRRPAPTLKGSFQSHPTTNNNRQLSAVYSLISMRNFAGHKTLRWPRGQCSAALSGCLIGPPDRGCQRSLSTNRRIESGNLEAPKSPYFSVLHAALGHNPATIWLLAAQINRRIPPGASGDFSIQGMATFHEFSEFTFFLGRLETPRVLRSIGSFVILAIFGL